MKQLITNNYNLTDSDMTEVVKRVKVLLVNSNNDVLLGYSHNNYQFPGGHVEENETLVQAVNREVLEETGIELTFNEKHAMEHFGKEQHMGGENDEEVVSDTEYFIVKLETKPEVKISREHARYKWFDKESIKEKQGKCIPDVFHYIQRYYDK